MATVLIILDVASIALSVVTLALVIKSLIKKKGK